MARCAFHDVNTRDVVRMSSSTRVTTNPLVTVVDPPPPAQRTHTHAYTFTARAHPPTHTHAHTHAHTHTHPHTLPHPHEKPYPHIHIHLHVPCVPPTGTYYSCTSECDCGAVPCGEYVFNHANDTFGDWFVNSYMISNETLLRKPLASECALDRITSCSAVTCACIRTCE